MTDHGRFLLALVALANFGSGLAAAGVTGVTAQSRIQHVLMISVDGMHAIDLALYVRNNPASTMAVLADRGVNYPNARTPLLGDSSPGLVSLATGGTPSVTGIIYSPTYDRALSPPGDTLCATRGTVYYIDEKPVKDRNREDSGGGIDPDKLPRDPARGCAPVYPHHLMRVNTVFEVLQQAGHRTAWIDQHEMYNDLIQGPSGRGITDSRALERKGTPGNFAGATAQDGRRVELLLNQIRGLDSFGRQRVGVPRLYGMGFISFGMLQKSEGYADARGALGDGKLKATLDFVDSSLGRIVAELRTHRLYDNTLILLTAKHGQSPIDLRRRRVIDRNIIRNAVNGVQPGLLAHGSLDSVGLLWLKDASKTDAAVEALRTNQTLAGIQKIYWGDSATALVNLPANDSRAPDIFIQPELGVFYADAIDSPETRALLAEHGGMLDEDTNVPLLLSFAGAGGQTINSGVGTQQVAPTILRAFGIDTYKLQAVQREHTAPLPGIAFRR